MISVQRSVTMMGLFTRRNYCFVKYVGGDWLMSNKRKDVEKQPITENLHFNIAKRDIECQLILYEHPIHKNEVVLEWRLDPAWNPSLIRIHKLVVPELIRRLKDYVRK